MGLFEFREFLRQNPSEDNLAFVFPSEDDVEVTPEMLAAISVVEITPGRTNMLHEETFDFFQLFLQELYEEQIGIHYYTQLHCVLLITVLNGTN